MSKFNYLIGFFKNLTNTRISKFALVDNYSKFHATSRICRKVKTIKSNIHAFTYISPCTEIVYANIGKFCSIGPECIIGLPSHSFNNISTSPIFTSKNNSTKYQWTHKNTYNEFKQINICNDVWIGSRVIVMGGVKIGNGAIIGAGAIVTKDVPDYTVVAGIPAKIIKYRFSKEIIDLLLKIKWWNMPDKKIKKNIQFFQKDNFSVEDLKTIN